MTLLQRVAWIRIFLLGARSFPPQPHPDLAPSTAAIAGAPAAFAFHTAQTGTRVVSTATTAAFGNPIVSPVEDILAVLTVLFAFLAPILIPIVAAVVLYAVWRMCGRSGGGCQT